MKNLSVHMKRKERGLRSVSTEYECWKNIKKRCLNPSHKQFKDYGARGITIHPEWVKNFDAFLDHVGKKPYPGVSLDRIDNEKGYVPGNLRWATPRVQNNNKRSPYRGVDIPNSLWYLNTVPMHFCF